MARNLKLVAYSFNTLKIGFKLTTAVNVKKRQIVEIAGHIEILFLFLIGISFNHEKNHLFAFTFSGLFYIKSPDSPKSGGPVTGKGNGV